MTQNVVRRPQEVPRAAVGNRRPIVVPIAVLTDLSLPVTFLWFGAFQIVWRLHYGAPVSVEPTKALAALVLAGTITTSEFLVAGLVLAVVLTGIGATRSLDRVERNIGEPVVRGVRLGVALVSLETGVGLGFADLQLAGLAVGISVLLIALGYGNLSAFVVLLFGGAVAIASAGIPAPALPARSGLLLTGWEGVTVPALGATLAQLAMALGNAVLATSVLSSDYFDRVVSPTELTGSNGLMNLLAVPFGALLMCRGSGGIAGEYAFGARTAGANVILGIGYVLVAVFTVGIVSAYPVPMLGVIPALIALQLGRTSVQRTSGYPLVIGIGALGVVVDLGVASVAGVFAHQILRGRET